MRILTAALTALLLATQISVAQSAIKAKVRMSDNQIVEVDLNEWALTSVILIDNLNVETKLILERAAYTNEDKANMLLLEVIGPTNRKIQDYLDLLNSMNEEIESEIETLFPCKRTLEISASGVYDIINALNSGEAANKDNTRQADFTENMSKCVAAIHSS